MTTTTKPETTHTYTFDKVFQRLSLSQSSDKYRHNLQGVWFDGVNNNAVATDGNQMAVIPFSEKEKQFNTLPNNQLVKFPKTIKTRSSTFQVNRTSGICTESPADSVSFGEADTFYPDYQKVFPDTEKLTFKVGLDAKRLLSLALSLGADKSQSFVTLEFDPNEPLTPVRVTVTKHDSTLDYNNRKDKGFGILMPVRFE